MSELRFLKQPGFELGKHFKGSTSGSVGAFKLLSKMPAYNP